jgi:dienelactone hydrolase
MSDHAWLPERWRREVFEDPAGRERTYYEVVPPEPHGSVLLMHEFPGISDHLVRFANTLATKLRVVVPSIVGRDGQASLAGSVAQLCIRREIHVFATGRTSPAVTWLRALADQVVARDGRPYGVVGMCMTGGFALALAVDPRVQAAVVAQPALPFARIGPIPLPGLARREADLSLSAEDRQQLRDRVDADDGLCVRAYRFRDDETSPAARMSTLETLLGDAVEVTTLTEPRPDGHSTLTRDRNDGAVAEVLAFLLDRLVT